MFTREDILKQIRRKNIVPAISSGIVTLFWSLLIFEAYQSTDYFLIIFWGIFFALFLYAFVISFQLVINPYKNKVFLKFKNIDNLVKIVNEIYNNRIFEDKNIIISEKYVIDKEDFSQISYLKDINTIHKFVKKKNYAVQYYAITINDKYEEYLIKYNVKDEDIIDIAINQLAFYSENAKIGYTKENRKYAKENREGFESTEQKKSICKVCGKEIYENEYDTCDKCHKIIMNRLKEKANIENIKLNSDNGVKKHCTNCGSEIDYDSKFCNECGFDLTRI